MKKYSKLAYTSLALVLSATFILVSSNRAFASVNPILCDFADGNCVNRAGCGDNPGSTWIISWTQDSDNCEDATLQPLYSACGNGYVTSTCPFQLGSGLNTEFQGDEIYEVLFYNEGYCIASNGSGNTILGTCPGSNGSGGANGTVMVLTPQVALVDRYWSRSHYPAYLCGEGYDKQLSEEVYYPNSYCQWEPRT